MSDIKHAVSSAVALDPTKISKHIVPKEIHKHSETFKKNNITPIAGFLGEEGMKGAIHQHNKYKPTLREFIKNNYTLKTMVKRAAERAGIGAAIGAGLAYYNNNTPEEITKAAATGAAISGTIGATVYPSVYYGAGRLSQFIHEKIKGDKK